MGARSKRRGDGGREGRGMLLVLERAVQSAGPGGIVITVWTPGQAFAGKDQKELSDYLAEKWGATFAGSVGPRGVLR